ncbi:MAG: CoA transferase, partial [Chloroflexi bacterium]|nr:CoA transferase [Chloroflexota bacterium]
LIMQGVGVPAGRVADGQQLLQDPQLKEFNLHREGVHPVSGNVLYTWNAFELSATPASVRRPAPLFGEHNEYVLRDLLGFSDGQVAALTEKGVIGDRPIV